MRQRNGARWRSGWQKLGCEEQLPSGNGQSCTARRHWPGAGTASARNEKRRAQVTPPNEPSGWGRAPHGLSHNAARPQTMPPGRARGGVGVSKLFAVHHRRQIQRINLAREGCARQRRPSKKRRVAARMGEQPELNQASARRTRGASILDLGSSTARELGRDRSAPHR